MLGVAGRALSASLVAEKKRRSRSPGRKSLWLDLSTTTTAEDIRSETVPADHAITKQTHHISDGVAQHLVVCRNTAASQCWQMRARAKHTHSRNPPYDCYS